MRNVVFLACKFTYFFDTTIYKLKNLLRVDVRL
jgi:hypothetical protein